jgi:hypothetical protein
MNENVVPIRKTDRFGLFKGRIEENGEVVESEQVGFAYIKPGSKMFRLKLWMLNREQYFLATHDHDASRYDILSLDEYAVNNEPRKSWHKIGEGEIIGVFIRLKFHLLGEDIFLSLFPETAEVAHVA